MSESPHLKFINLSAHPLGFPARVKSRKQRIEAIAGQIIGHFTSNGNQYVTPVPGEPWAAAACDTAINLATRLVDRIDEREAELDRLWNGAPEERR